MVDRWSKGSERVKNGCSERYGGWRLDEKRSKGKGRFQLPGCRAAGLALEFPGSEGGSWNLQWISGTSVCTSEAGSPVRLGDGGGGGLQGKS